MIEVEGVPACSMVPGILWPPMLPPEGAQALALQFQLEDTQWWAPERLAEWQFRALRPLVAHAAATVPHYRQSLRGIDPASLDPGGWREVPVIRRDQIQGREAEFRSERSPPEHGPVTDGRTSGSTGRPLEYSLSGLSALMARALTLRNHLWHRRDFSGRLAVVSLLPATPAEQGWGPSIEAVYRTGPCHMLPIRATVDEQMAWLSEVRPDYLMTYPSNLQALATRCLDSGGWGPVPREVWTFAEIVPSGLRGLCRQAWNAPLVDFYGARETGIAALQCPDREHYHVQSEDCFLEVLRDDGSECGPGEVGRVVITPLHNYAMPLLRYDIGDFAEVGETCSCGRGLPVLRRIVGRARNMLVLPDGGRRWPAFTGGTLGRLAPIRQFQFVQRSVETIELHMVVEHPPDRTEEDAVKAFVLEKLGHPFTLELVYVQSIPRSAGGKFEDFMCEVPC